jgi:indole-3-glycerol phosphate synthase
MLKQILEHKRGEVAGLDEAASRRAAEAAAQPKAFLGRPNLPAPIREAGDVESGGRQALKPAWPRLIAEVKRASPSRGVLAPHLDEVEIAQVYAANGAAAISVLTDERFFLGKLETLKRLRAAGVALPLLRKDFILTRAQVYETRAAGADAVLLIAAALTDDGELAELHALALGLGLAPLVEVHTAAEVERALKLPGLRWVGINNRDLGTFAVSVETTERLRPLIPPEVAVVAESGIFTAADVARLARAGAQAVLVGEALVTAGDIALKVRELSGMDVDRET